MAGQDPRIRRAEPAASLTAILILSFFCLLSPVLGQAAGGYTPVAAPPLLVEGVTVIDGTGKPPIAGASVMIEGGRIREIGRKGTIAAPPGARVIQAEGKYLIPGLIDSHVHYNAPWLHRLYLANGVTSVRDLGTSTEAIVMLRKEIASGNILAPRLFVSGNPINAASLKAANVGAGEMAKRLVQAGVDGVKVTGYTAAQLKEIVAVAHANGLIVYGHTGPKINGEGPGALAAVEAGLDGIEHVIQMVEDCLDGKVPVPAGFDPSHRDQLFRHYYGRLYGAFNPAKLDTLIRAMVGNNVYLDATLVNYERNFARRNTPELAADPALRYMPEDRADRYGRYESQEREEWKKVIQLMKEATLKFYKAGGFLIVGTDSQAASPDGALPGWSLHQEMEALVRAGIPPMHVLQAATLNNAKVMRQEKQLGTVEVGKYADLVLLDGDPLENITNTQKIYLVIRGGLVLDPRSLLEENLKQFGERKK